MRFRQKTKPISIYYIFNVYDSDGLRNPVPATQQYTRDLQVRNFQISVFDTVSRLSIARVSGISLYTRTNMKIYSSVLWNRDNLCEKNRAILVMKNKSLAILWDNEPAIILWY